MQKLIEQAERQSTDKQSGPNGEQKPKVDVLKAARLSVTTRARLETRPAGLPAAQPLNGRQSPGSASAAASSALRNGVISKGSVPIVAVGRAARKRTVKAPLIGGRRGSQQASSESQRQRQRPETRSQMLERLTNPLISLHEASVLLRVCPATVRRYTKSGLLTHVRTEGRQRRFYLQDVLAVVEQLESGQF